MITVAFLIACPAPQAPQHPKLHSTEVVFYAEVPDLRAMLAAYERAPLVQMVRDEQARGAVQRALETFDIDLEQVHASFGALLRLPEERRSAPFSALVDHLRGIQSASMSVTFSGSDKIAGFGAWTQTIERLQHVQTAVTRHQKANEGNAPASLDELDLGESWAADGWGRPFVYRADEDGGFGLSSLGSDGEPGGEGFAADVSFEHAEELATQFAETILREFGFMIACQFAAPDRATAASAIVEQGFTALGMARGEDEQLDYLGARDKLTRWSHPKLDGLELWTLHGDRWMVLGGGHVTPENAQRTSVGQLPSLATVEDYRALFDRMPKAGGVEIGRFFMQTDALAKLFAEAGSSTEDLKTMLELSAGTCAGRMTLAGDRFVTEMVGRTRQKKYFGSSMGQRPFTAEMARNIPDDAIGFYGTTVDGAALHREIMIALRAQPNGKDIEARFRELEEKHGIDLHEDIFDNVSGAVVGYLLPITSVMGPPGMAAVAELKDPQKFTAGVRSLFALLAEQKTGDFTVTEKPYSYKDQKIPMWTFSLNAAASGQGGPMGGAALPSPTVAIAGNRLIITLNRARAGKEIKRLLGEDVSNAHPLFASGNAVPAEATAVGYMDWAACLNGVYKGVVGLVKLVGGMANEGKLDVGGLPDDPTVFTKFFKPTILWSKPIGEGETYLRNEASFGPETWLGVFAVGGMAYAVIADLKDGDAADAPDDEAEAPADVPESSSPELVDTRAAIAQLATALSVHRIELGRFPATLSDLTRPTANFPKGFLSGEPLPNDGWGRAFRYELEPDGSSYSLWSRGPDGTDQRGEGDDVAAH